MDPTGSGKPLGSVSIVRLVTDNSFVYQVNIYDTQGKLLVKFENSPQFISVDNLQSGIYFVEILNMQTGAKHAQKLIKN